MCVPATIDLAGAEIELVSLVARETRLQKAVAAYVEEREASADRLDYVLIDCPPSLGLLTVNAFVAASEVFIPIQCEYYALEGLSQLLKNIELIRNHLNPRLHVSTILLTMYDGRTRLSSQVADEVREHFPDQTLRASVPRSVRISEAPSHGQTVMTYDPNSSGALSYLEAAVELAERGAPRRPPRRPHEREAPRPGPWPGALIPSGAPATDRPVDVFFRDRDGIPARRGGRRVGAHGATDAGAAAGQDGALVPVRSRRTTGTSLQPVPGAEFAEIPLDADPAQPAPAAHRLRRGRPRRAGALDPRDRRPAADRRPPGPEAGPATRVRFELIMGERRWRASREAGKDTVPAIIRMTEEDDLLRDALLENLHRSQLNALEEAAAYQQLLDDFGCTQEELARRIGRSRPQISNTPAPAQAAPDGRPAVAAGVLSAGHARALLALPDAAAMERLAHRIVAEGCRCAPSRRS